uniref:Uncharacterized protein n=1 Tax=Romanomermis culicivorax TaxID=13658 RepID=A0A915J909_ROMCU
MTKPSPGPILRTPSSILNQRTPQPPTLVSANNYSSSLAIANTNEVHNFRFKARDALDQLSTAAARMTNNVPM